VIVRALAILSPGVAASARRLDESLIICGNSDAIEKTEMRIDII
jgi:hypothetical protein